MRKMYSQNQIKNLVQEAITEGQIEIPQELPSQEGAEVGDVLKIGADGLEWGAGGGGSPVAYEGTSELPEGVEFKSWTLHRAIQDGNILWIVITGIIENTNASAKNIADIMSLSLPLEIQEKIYRQDGTTIDQAYVSSYIVTTFLGRVQYSSDISIESSTAGRFLVKLSSSYEIYGNDTTDVDIRFPIFLDIGEVQE